MESAVASTDPERTAQPLDSNGAFVPDDAVQTSSDVALIQVPAQTSERILTPSTETPSSPLVVKARPNGVYIASLLFVLFAGGMGTVQTAFNNGAGTHFTSFLLGTWLSFAGGLILLVIVVLMEMHASKLPLWHWKARPSIFQCMPGALGVIYVSAAVALTTITGFTLFFIAAVLGQLLMSSVLDHFGWLNSKKMPITLQKGVGLILALAGAILSSIDRLTSTTNGASSVAIGLCFLGAVFAGAIMPIQTALNRSTSEILPSKLQTTMFSFSVGLLTATIAVGLHMAADNSIALNLQHALATADWWMFAGGPLGVLYIASGIWFVRVVGSAAFFVTLVCGQLSGSATIDAVGFLGRAQLATTATRVAGILIVVAAAAIMQFPMKVKLPVWRGKIAPATPTTTTDAQVPTPVKMLMVKA